MKLSFKNNSKLPVEFFEYKTYNRHIIPAATESESGEIVPGEFVLENNGVVLFKESDAIEHYNKLYLPLYQDSVGVEEVEPYTVSEYNSKAANHELDGMDVYIVIDGQTFSSKGLDLYNVQQYQNPPKLHLIVKNCEFTGATASGKQMYLTNVVDLLIEGCSFKDNSVSDYGVDINMVGVQNCSLIFKRCSFENTGIKSAIKISARMGRTDHPSDIIGPEATIHSVVISECSFANNVCDVTFGTSPKGTDTEANITTGAYDVTLLNNMSDVVVKEPYLVDKGVNPIPVTIKAHTTIGKQASNMVSFAELI